MRYVKVLALVLLAVTPASYAQVAISQLPAANALTGAEEIPLVQGASTARTTAADIAALAGGATAGLWTPVCTPEAPGMTACTGIQSHYVRVGDQVIFAIWLNVTASNASSQATLTLPVPSSFTTSTDAVGTCTGNSNGSVARLQADGPDDALRMFVLTQQTTSLPWACTGIYTVL